MVLVYQRKSTPRQRFLRIEALLFHWINEGPFRSPVSPIDARVGHHSSTNYQFISNLIAKFYSRLNCSAYLYCASQVQTQSRYCVEHTRFGAVVHNKLNGAPTLVTSPLSSWCLSKFPMPYSPSRIIRANPLRISFRSKCRDNNGCAPAQPLFFLPWTLNDIPRRALSRKSDKFPGLFDSLRYRLHLVPCCSTAARNFER